VTPMTDRILRLEETVANLASRLDPPALSRRSLFPDSPGHNPQSLSFCSPGSSGFTARSLVASEGGVGNWAGSHTDGGQCPSAQVPPLALGASMTCAVQPASFFIGTPRSPCDLPDKWTRDAVTSTSYEMLDLVEPSSSDDVSEEEVDPSNCGATVWDHSPKPRERGAGAQRPALRVKEQERKEDEEESLWGYVRAAVALLDEERNTNDRLHAAKGQLQKALQQRRCQKETVVFCEEDDESTEDEEASHQPLDSLWRD